MVPRRPWTLDWKDVAAHSHAPLISAPKRARIYAGSKGFIDEAIPVPPNLSLLA
ncbi:tsl1390 [Thermosynechococcus vestitus BP-1]|uniref:Tsl1390 protein n=1 Tax=Thermosynechococcus vestitus (strain NIES-2133 / IAM M-273 / BP-1) TaxID=197221 RepID=Q8DJ39_THEVB|nr:tsl1390 [Thermosynechococcus vestitus BP-1]